MDAIPAVIENVAVPLPDDIYDDAPYIQPAMVRVDGDLRLPSAPAQPSGTVPADATLGAVAPANLRVIALRRALVEEGTQETTTLADALRCLGDRSAFRRLWRPGAAPTDESDRPLRVSRIPAAVVAQIDDVNLSWAVREDAPRGVEARLKLVPKRGDDAHLWRVILACVELNDRTVPPPRCPLPPVREVILQLMAKSWAVTTDFRSWFFQFPVCRAVAQAAFGWRSRGRRWAFSRLPMGWSWAPYIATSTAQWMYRRAVTRSEAKSIYSTVWVDDGILAGDDKQSVARARASAITVFDEFGAELKAAPTDASIGQQFRYIGVDWDLQAKRWKVSQAWAELLGERVATLADGGRMSLCEFWRLVGAAVWVCHIAWIPFAVVAPALIDLRQALPNGPLLRREVGRFAAKALITPSVAARRALEAAANAATQWRNLPRPWSSLPHTRVASDASPSGMGWVHQDGRWTSRAWAGTQTHRIMQIGELRAARLAVEAVRAPTGAAITLFTDNAGVWWRLSRWATGGVDGWPDIVLLWQALARREQQLRVVWIPSELQPADGPSRAGKSATGRCQPPPWPELERAARIMEFPPAPSNVRLHAGLIACAIEKADTTARAA